MKKITLNLILVSLLTINTVNAQFDTTINMRLNRLELNSEAIQSNLGKCHKQWVNGGGICIFGLGASILGGYMSINTNYYDDKSNVGLIITGVGGLASLIGTVIMLDSHKYIGRAGLGVGANGVSYRFK